MFTEFTDQQLEQLQQLYKEELGLEITLTEALAQALTLMRYLTGGIGLDTIDFTEQ